MALQSIMSVPLGNYFLSGTLTDLSYIVYTQLETLTNDLSYGDNIVAMSSNGQNLIARLGTYPNLNLYYSNNYGVNWAASAASANHKYATFCSPRNHTNVFYAGCIDGDNNLYRSSDGGASFTLVNSDYDNYSGICCNDDDTILYISHYVHALYYSTNQGTSFTQIPSSNTGNEYTSMACSTTGSFLYGTSNTTGIFTYDASSGVLVASQSINSGNSFFTNMNANGTILYASGIYGSGFYKSTNRTDFVSAGTGLPANVGGFGYILSCGSSGKDVQAVPYAGGSVWYVSSDFGDTFVEASTPLPPAPFMNNADRFVSYVADTSFNFVNTVPCFLQGSRLLALIQGKEEYVPIEELRVGDLVRTYQHGFVPVSHIGSKTILSDGTPENSLYKLSPDFYPELDADLFLTGFHSVLVDDLTHEQEAQIRNMIKNVYITDDKYRLPVCLDTRAEIATDSMGHQRIYHLALENDDYYGNYGVYANGGLLVETTSQRYMAELSDMKLIR
jgi:hypothetical protein